MESIPLENKEESTRDHRPGKIILSDPSLSEPYGVVRVGDKLVLVDANRSSGRGVVRVFSMVTQDALPSLAQGFRFPAGLALWSNERLLLVDNGGGGSLILLGAEGEEKRLSDPLDDPKDVAADVGRGRIFVADRGNNRVLVLDEDFVTIDSWAPPDDHFVPNGLALGHQGRLFVSDKAGARVWVFSREGKVEGSWGRSGRDMPEEMALPGGVAVDPWGRVYVADYARDSIHVFSREGDHIGLMGGEEANDPSFGRPRGLFYDAVSGRLLVTGGDRQLNVARVWSLPLWQLGSAE